MSTTFIQCDCLEHSLSIEKDLDDPGYYWLSFWSSPDAPQYGYFKRLWHAILGRKDNLHYISVSDEGRLRLISALGGK